MQIKNYILSTVPAVALLVSCTEKAEQEQYGAVCFDLGTDIVLQPASKAAVPDDVLAEFIVSVPGTAVSGRYSEVAGQKYFLPPGDYAASAYYPLETADEVKTLNDGYGELHYYGVQEFNVSAGNDTQNVSVSCLPDNARVSVVYSSAFMKAFDMEHTSAYVAEDSDFTVRVLQIEEGKPAYFSAGDRISIKVCTSLAGKPDKPMEFVYADHMAAECRCSYTVTIDVATNQDGITFIIAGNDIVTGNSITLESYTPGTVVEDI